MCRVDMTRYSGSAVTSVVNSRESTTTWKNVRLPGKVALASG